MILIYYSLQYAALITYNSPSNSTILSPSSPTTAFVEQHPLSDQIQLDLNVISDLKSRLSQELQDPITWNSFFGAKNASFLSCCRENQSDFRFNSSSFIKDAISIRERFIKENIQRDIIVSVGQRIPPNLILETLQESESILEKHSIYFVFVSSGYDRRGSPFYGCGTSAAHPRFLPAANHLLDHHRVRLWWVTNHECSFTDSKLRYLPLGSVENCCSPHSQSEIISALQRIHSDSASRTRSYHYSNPQQLIYLSIGLKSGHTPKIEHRMSVIESLKSLYPELQNDFSKFQTYTFFKKASSYPFVASPRGIASDCYRHYQALYSGSVPLVDFHHSLIEPLKDLPIIFVTDWNNVTVEFLVQKSKELLSRKDPFHWNKLSQLYWYDKVIESAKKTFSEERPKRPYQSFNTSQNVSDKQQQTAMEIATYESVVQEKNGKNESVSSLKRREDQLSVEEFELIMKLKRRVQSEVFEELRWKSFFGSTQNENLLSCCRDSDADFSFGGNNALNASFLISSLQNTLNGFDTQPNLPSRHFIINLPSPVHSRELLIQLNSQKVQSTLGNRKVVLITSGYDRNGSPFFGCGLDFRSKLNSSAHFQLLEHPSVKYYWMSNHECWLKHEKLRFLPLGVVEDCCNAQGLKVIASALNKGRRELMELQKSKRNSSITASSQLIFLSIGLRSGYSPKVIHRKYVIERLQENFPGLENIFARSKLSEFLKIAGESPFVASPRGLASDCYRHYQSLMLGSIPILDSHHTLTEPLDGLPIISVTNWTQVTPQFLVQQSESLLKQDQFQWKKLTNAYWTRQILNSAAMSNKD
uniref:Exostosin GT47 domain-containing protein n=1 Tax=Timspurckia oligopyrenoides TaxID=708627 RepID=A0A6T6N8I7_9RHOD